VILPICIRNPTINPSQLLYYTILYYTSDYTNPHAQNTPRPTPYPSSRHF
jgi:hypothetical protein